MGNKFQVCLQIFFVCSYCDLKCHILESSGVGMKGFFHRKKSYQIAVQTECQLLRARDFLFHSHLKNFFIFIYLKTTKICLYETFSEGAGTGILCRSNDGRHVDSVVMNTGMPPPC